MKIKHTLSIVLAIAGMGFISASEPDSQKNEVSFYCNYAGETYNENTPVSRGSDLAQERVSTILNIAGMEKNFTIMSANVKNASALVYGSNRYALFNPDFIQSMYDAEGNIKWANYGILAHEVGHHYYEHIAKKGKSRSAMELQADEFSGYVLCKMGATLKEAQTALKSVSYANGKKARLQAIARGWNKANAQMGSRI